MPLITRRSEESSSEAVRCRLVVICSTYSQPPIVAWQRQRHGMVHATASRCSRTVLRTRGRAVLAALPSTMGPCRQSYPLRWLLCSECGDCLLSAGPCCSSARSGWLLCACGGGGGGDGGLASCARRSLTWCVPLYPHRPLPPCGFLERLPRCDPCNSPRVEGNFWVSAGSLCV